MEEKATNYPFAILNLYRTDYTTNLHVRAIAKQLTVSHVTILPYLKRLEKNKILISRKVGKNKEYSLNLSNVLTKYYLTVTEELATIRHLEKNFLIKKIADHLISLDIMGPLILFGSYAKDYATQASDIDLLYIGNFPENREEQIEKFGKTFGKEINVKTCTMANFSDGLRTSDNLIKEIVKNHIVLQNSDAFVSLLWTYYAER
jgi:predicted nucleotidyltransferase